LPRFSAGARDAPVDMHFCGVQRVATWMNWQVSYL
jgi:hypothetical protein